MMRTSLRLLAGALLGLLPCLVSAQIGQSITLTPQSPNLPAGPTQVTLAFDIDGVGGIASGSTTTNPVAQRFELSGNPLILPTGPVTTHLFCIELTEFSPQSAMTYWFESLQLNLQYRGASDSATRAQNIAKLYSSAFANEAAYLSFFSSPSTVNIQAFQLALWNLVYENDFLVDDNVADANGNFKISSGSTSTIIAQANAYLTGAFGHSLSSTSPSVFALENPNLPSTAGGKQDYLIPIFPGGDKIIVPEPSTYALLFGIATLGVVTVRRRFRKSAA